MQCSKDPVISVTSSFQIIKRARQNYLLEQYREKKLSSLSDTAGCVNSPNGEGITHTVDISAQMYPVIMHADLWGLKPVWVSFSVGLFRCFRCSKYQLKGTIKSKLTHFMQFCSYKLFILAHHCYKKYLLISTINMALFFCVSSLMTCTLLCVLGNRDAQ